MRFTCNFLFMCSGYYSYEAGYTPEFPGIERFQGRIVHPQKWTRRYRLRGQARRRHRQWRDGGDTGAGNGKDRCARDDAATIADLHRRAAARGCDRQLAAPPFPRKFAYGVTRWKNVLLGMLFYNLCRRSPERMKQRIIDLVKDELDGTCDVDRHFTPRYNPWDQRLCLVPNGDLFEVLKQGKAAVVTDQIETFTERGLKLRSGVELPADLIVTATGLNLQVLGDLN